MDMWGMMLMCKTFLLTAGVAAHEGGGLLVVEAIHLEVGHLHTVGKIPSMPIGTSNCTFFFFCINETNWHLVSFGLYTAASITILSEAQARIESVAIRLVLRRTTVARQHMLVKSLLMPMGT